MAFCGGSQMAHLQAAKRPFWGICGPVLRQGSYSRISRQGRAVKASRWGKQSAWLSAPHIENRAVARTRFRKEKGMQNTRKRAETLTIRLTKAEKEMIQKKAKKAQLSIFPGIVQPGESKVNPFSQQLLPAGLPAFRIPGNGNRAHAGNIPNKHIAVEGRPGFLGFRAVKIYHIPILYTHHMVRILRLDSGIF